MLAPEEGDGGLVLQCFAGWDMGLRAMPRPNGEQPDCLKSPHLGEKGANGTLHGKFQCLL